MSLTEREQEIQRLAKDLEKYVHRTDAGDWIDHGIEKAIESDIPFLLSTIQQLREELKLSKENAANLEHNRRLLSGEKEQLRQENERLKEAFDEIASVDSGYDAVYLKCCARQALKGD